jgi:hypothetical protein
MLGAGCGVCLVACGEVRFELMERSENGYVVSQVQPATCCRGCLCIQVEGSRRSTKAPVIPPARDVIRQAPPTMRDGGAGGPRLSAPASKNGMWGSGALRCYGNRAAESPCFVCRAFRTHAIPTRTTATCHFCHPWMHRTHPHHPLSCETRHRTRPAFGSLIFENKYDPVI